MSRIHIITGALGFIGRELVRALSVSESSIWCVEIDSVINECATEFALIYPYSKLMNIYQLLEELKLIDYEEIVLYHLAYSTLHTIARDSLEPAMRDMNILVSILDSIKNYDNVSIRFLSSSGVYGPMRGLAIDEKTPLVAENPYTYMKCNCEEILEYYSRINFIPTTIFRLFTCYGEKQSRNTVIGKLIQSRKDPSLSVDLYKYGSQVRDFLHVSDIILAITSPSIRKRGFNIYNLSGDESMTLREFSNIIGANIRLLGVPVKDDVITGSNLRIKEDLGWQPICKLEDFILDEYQKQ